MRHSVYASFVLASVVACPVAASAAPIYDFSTVSSGAVTDLGTSALLPGGIIAYGFVYTDNPPGGAWAPSTLIGRNETFEDAGLGVCSEGADACAIGGTGSGDYNELSQLIATEAILLQRPENMLWSGLWLSSLDAGGTNGSERGLLYWSNSTGTLLSGPFTFGYPEFDGVSNYGQLLLPQEFDPSALFVLFLPGGAVGENNDYLVWGADLVSRDGGEVTPAPEPATLLLLGTGLAGVAYRVRRSKRL